MNVIDTIGNQADGKHTIIRGRVVGNDVSGNISKYIMIQDATAALCFSIDAYDLNESYHVGQEVVVDLTDMYIGKYNRQYLMGYPEWYATGNTWEAGRMPLDLMQGHAQVNGLVDLAKVDTTAVTIPAIKAVAESDTDNLLYWNHRLVKFENVRFEDGKLETFAPYHQNNVVRNLVDADGNVFPTYNSGYADFYNDTIPAGYGTVVGILSYVGKDGWRLTLREKSDCVGFDPDAEAIKPPVTGEGTLESPYSVQEVIAMNPSSTSVAVKSGVWVSGYIVGWADMSTVYSITSETARFSVPATMATNMIVAATPDETNVNNCIGIQLPSGTVRSALNLVDNPGNLGKAVKLKGDVMKYSGVAGLKNVSEFELDGQSSGGDQPSGDVLLEAKFTDGQGELTIDNVNVPAAVSAVWKQDAKYGMVATSYLSSNQTNYDAEAWLVSPVIDFTSASAPTLVFDQIMNFFADMETAKKQATVWARVEGGAWQALTVPQYPASLSWNAANSGQVSLEVVKGKKAQIGFKYVGTAAKAGTWQISNLKVFAN